MCKPFKEYLNLAREYTRELFTFGGFVVAVFIYLDFKDLAKEQASTAAATTEILRAMDLRLSQLEKYRNEHYIK